MEKNQIRDVRQEKIEKDSRVEVSYTPFDRGFTYQLAHKSTLTCKLLKHMIVQVHLVQAAHFHVTDTNIEGIQGNIMVVLALFWGSLI